MPSEMKKTVRYSIFTDPACSLTSISFGATSDLSSPVVSKPVTCPQQCQCNSVHSCSEPFWIKFRSLCLPYVCTSLRLGEAKLL